MVITVFVSGTDIELMFEGDRITVDGVIDKLVSDDIIGLWNRDDYLNSRFCDRYENNRNNRDNRDNRDNRNNKINRDKLREDLKSNIMLSKMSRYHILSANDFIYHEDRLFGICTL